VVGSDRAELSARDNASVCTGRSNTIPACDTGYIRMVSKYSSIRLRHGVIEGVRLDGCVAWNAHNTVFVSKRSAICALDAA